MALQLRLAEDQGQRDPKALVAREHPAFLTSQGHQRELGWLLEERLGLQILLMVTWDLKMELIETFVMIKIVLMFLYQTKSHGSEVDGGRMDSVDPEGVERANL